MSQALRSADRFHLNVLSIKTAMQIVFDNLIDNAMKYSAEQVEIQINLSTNIKKRIVIELQDNGIGIETKNYKNIFNKFKE